MLIKAWTFLCQLEKKKAYLINGCKRGLSINKSRLGTEELHVRAYFTDANQMWPDVTAKALSLFAMSNPLRGAQVGRGLGRNMSLLAWWDAPSGITRSDKQSPTSTYQLFCSFPVLQLLTSHGDASEGLGRCVCVWVCFGWLVWIRSDLFKLSAWAGRRLEKDVLSANQTKIHPGLMWLKG